MRYCVHCGAPLDAGQRFCSSCGRAAEPAAAPAAQTTPAPAYAAPPPPPLPPLPPQPPLPPLPPRRGSGGRVVAAVLLALAVAGAGVGAFALVRHLTAPEPAPAAASPAPVTTQPTTQPPVTTTTTATTTPTVAPAADPTDDATAAVALRQLAAQDRPAVLALHGAWTVQLTSKTDGTVDASGRVWHWRDIWTLHQQLLASHPDALLVDTDEWGSYQLGGYYATITGDTFPNKAATLDWCRTQHLDRDACAGKRVRVDGDYRTDIALQPE